LRKLKNFNRLEIKELEVENKVLLKNFVEDCDILIHGGTPFQLDVQDPKTELFDPTIKGTENFLEMVQQSKTIKKVIFVASVAAYNTNFPLPAGGKTPNDSFSEKDTPFMSEEGHPYAQAKFIANQTVEKFIKDNPKLSFEITSVSPVGVMGKSLSNREDSTSIGLQFLFKNNIAPNPFVQMLYDTNAEMAIIDVKDVAEAIFKAATISGLHGKNYLLSSESYSVSDISRMLNNQPAKNKGRIIYDNQLAKQDLGINFKPAIEPLHAYNS
jgi:nucleoside-diphosphate-sugar epimerase